jgi:hypothetical protein
MPLTCWRGEGSSSDQLELAVAEKSVGRCHRWGEDPQRPGPTRQ